MTFMFEMCLLYALILISSSNLVVCFFIWEKVLKEGKKRIPDLDLDQISIFISLIGQRHRLLLTSLELLT